MFGAASLGVVMIVLGGLLFMKGKAPKTVILCFLVTGIVVQGVVRQWLGLGTKTIIGGATQLGTIVGISGAALVAALVIAATIDVVYFGLIPKKAQPKKYHPFLAVMLPTLIAVAGVPILVNILAGFSNLLGIAGAA